MSRMANTTRSRRPRRRFDDDFKAQAVRLILDDGKTVGAVARDLDLTETALREWQLFEQVFHQRDETIRIAAVHRVNRGGWLRLRHVVCFLAHSVNGVQSECCAGLQLPD